MNDQTREVSGVDGAEWVNCVEGGKERVILYQIVIDNQGLLCPSPKHAKSLSSESSHQSRGVEDARHPQAGARTSAHVVSGSLSIAVRPAQRFFFPRVFPGKGNKSKT
jgi:hypothetical protein